MRPIQKIKVGEILDRDYLEGILREMNYQKCEAVSRPGEYAVRGGILDIYPMTYRLPIRLEFESDRILAIRNFSTIEGTPLAHFDEVYLIPVSETFEKKISRFKEQFEAYEPLTSVTDLESGDYVVHLKYGIGRFLGTKQIQIQGQMRRHLAIEYAAREILYLDPKEPLERYIGGEGVGPKLTKLNTREWERVKKKTRLAVHRVAQEMLQLQAKRKLLHGFSFPKDQPWQKEFEAEFPFEETADQKKAVEEVKRDMESARSMDRLLCGDVGYGKTEVAMRAAFK
ncbi:MAG: hypothetical protein NC930_07365, partial [Candidatus Omnitrophica bacterium]|nr:hypothetical protein [Candidatus Omnitrophota bacterium]